MLLRRVAILWLAGLLCVGAAYGQATPPAATEGTVVKPSSDEMAKVLEREFGPGFTLDTTSPVIHGDFDGDGVEDLALVATGKNPLTSAVEYHFRVIDPYNGYFGYGNPKVTMTFGTETGKPKFVLIVHSWQAPVAKAKFVVVNLPFVTIEKTHAVLKKKTIAAISAQEDGGITSIVFWDGKKYRWEVTGSMN